MSTKSSIASGTNFHFYSEMLDDNNVYLDLENVQFQTSEHHVLVAIPVAVWEVIRQHSPVDLSFADRTDDEIRKLVESAVQERSKQFAEASERNKAIISLGGSMIYGTADASQSTQIAKGWDYFIRLRQRQSKIKKDIENLKKMQQPLEAQ